MTQRISNPYYRKIERHDETIPQLVLRVTRLERLANIDHYGRDLLRCLHAGCSERHPVIQSGSDERVTCPTCLSIMSISHFRPPPSPPTTDPDRDLLRCRYSDCHEAHPVAPHDDFVTCPTCRKDMGLDRATPSTPSTTSNQAASPVSSTAAATDADKEDAMTPDPATPDPPASPLSPTPLNQVIMAQLMEFISNKVMTMYEAPDHVQHFDPIQPMHMPGVGRVGYTCRIWYMDEDRWMKSMVLSLRDEEAVKVGIQLAKADVQRAIAEREEKMGSVDDE